MEIAIGIAIGLFLGGMAYLRATAKLTKTKLDDKALALGEKIEPFVKDKAK